MKHLFMMMLAIMLLLGCGVKDIASESGGMLPSADEKMESASSTEAPVALLTQYVIPEVSPGLYSNFESTDDTSMNIWCVDIAQVKSIIEDYSGPDVKVFYYAAQYPQSLLSPYVHEIADSEIFIQNAHKLDSISITGEGIEILVQDLDDFNEISTWLKNYENKAYVIIKDLSGRIVRDSEPANSAPAIPEASETDEPSGNQDVLLRLQAISEQYQYLRENLSENDYSHMKRADNTITIWCTNEEAVRQVVEAYSGSKHAEIIYQPAEYSFATLEPVLEELTALGLLKNKEIVVAVSITEKGICIHVADISQAGEVQMWLNSYEKKACVYIEELRIAPPSNPS